MARLIHARKVRHRSWDRLRRSLAFLSWLADEAARLSGTGALLATVTFANLTEQMTWTAHLLASGAGPYLLSNSGGALPAELDTTTLYWFNVVDANIVTLHLTEADAIAGTNIVAFSDNGTGINSTLLAADAEELFEVYMLGKHQSAERIRGETNLDNL